MSEYQYYEFRAIDRPLDKAAREALRGLSSRANITATSFTNTYQWGDFKGDPEALMREWFDLHLYLANWGSRRLMIRVPERLIDRRIVDACLIEPEFASVRVAGDDLILDVNLNEMEVDWDEGPGWLDQLAPLRADWLGGDQRLLYLIWLMAVESDIAAEGTPEPLPGIGPLTGALEAFATFFAIDPDLVAAAAERDATPGLGAVSRSDARQVIAGLPEPEKIILLTRLFDGDPHVGAKLRATVRSQLGTATELAPRRTAADLRARAEAIGRAREQEARRLEAEKQARLAQEQEAKRRERLVAIARRGEGVWRDVEAEIERSNASSYARAADLLLDLRVVAEERDSLPAFTGRIAQIRERHARKARFLQRIVDLV